MNAPAHAIPPDAAWPLLVVALCLAVILLVVLVLAILRGSQSTKRHLGDMDIGNRELGAELWAGGWDEESVPIGAHMLEGTGRMPPARANSRLTIVSPAPPTAPPEPPAKPE